MSAETPVELTACRPSSTAAIVLAAAQSPSLQHGLSAVNSAFELKCLLDPDQAVALERSLSALLSPDPHIIEAGGYYDITTLATDTADYRVFRRQPGFASHKFRIRRYGRDEQVYLEHKTRRGSRVRKTRTVVDQCELRRLRAAGHAGPTGDGEIADTSWTGQWFEDRVARRQLQPVCLIRCRRTAWFGEREYGPVRLTFDRNLAARLVAEWSLNDTGGFQPMTDLVVCEFKFSISLPQVFRQAFEQFQLNPRGYSKYRNCLSRLTGGADPACDAQELPCA